jgi:hypothetical protein
MSLPLNQLTGGAFQDSEGNPLVDGYLELKLSAVAVSGTVQVVPVSITIPLDDSGNVVTDPTYSVVPNDQLTPSDTYYLASAFTSAGQRVWGPNAIRILSSPSPFDLGGVAP